KLSCRAWILGIEAMQVPHHVAQKSRSSTFPLYSSNVARTVSPSTQNRCSCVQKSVGTFSPTVNALTVVCLSAARVSATYAQAIGRLNNMKHKNPTERILMFFKNIREDKILENQSSP